MKVLISIFVLISGSVWASTAPALEIPVFPTWKQQQIVRSQNEVVRLTNEILMAQSSDHQILNTWDETINPNESVARQDQVSQALKQARQNLEIAKELEFDDYLEIHMEVLLADRESLKAWISKLSPDEVAGTFHYLAAKGKSDVLPPIDVGAASEIKTINAN